MSLLCQPLTAVCFTDKEMLHIVPRSYSEDFEFALERALAVLRDKGLLRLTDSTPKLVNLEDVLKKVDEF